MRQALWFVATVIVAALDEPSCGFIVCTDNPYEAVWQPAEGTCERFVAAGTN